MENKDTKRYMELQMDELKETYASESKVASSKPKPKSQDEKDRAIGKLYEDAWEYEEDLACFEAELELVKSVDLKDLGTTLLDEFPGEDRDYNQELQNVLERAWTNYVELEQSKPLEQLEFIKTNTFSTILEQFRTKFPSYESNFENEVKEILVARWEMLIAIKKEHIKEEIDDIKTMGLKPNYVKRMYKQYCR